MVRRKSAKPLYIGSNPILPSMEKTIAQLMIEANDDNADTVVFMGSNWVEDEAIKDEPFPGKRYAGEKLCVNCNDAFWWAVADCEDITEETLPQFNQAIKDCNGDEGLAAWLYCARKRGMRVQGAAYSYIPEELWPLFDACGPEREKDFFNPYKQGTYKTCSGKK